MTTFTAAGILNVGSPTSDGGIRIRFETQEMSSLEKVALMDFNGKQGWLLFRENSFTDADVPKEDAPDDGKKPSQRLRSVLFLLWKERGSKGDFNVWYREKIEAIISEVKSKLDL